jgi:hypothetical protein
MQIVKFTYKFCPNFSHDFFDVAIKDSSLHIVVELVKSGLELIWGVRHYWQVAADGVCFIERRVLDSGRRKKTRGVMSNENQPSRDLFLTLFFLEFNKGSGH